MSSTETYLIDTFTFTSIQLNRYFSIFIFFFGVIGNILNILILSQRTFRFNPCIFFFLTSSIANLISILAGLIPRILSSWNADLTTTNDLLCKLRAFIIFTSRTIALWLIMFATIDRWIISSTNTQRRQLSSLKNAQRSVLILIICSSLAYSQMLYCYEANLVDTPLNCYGKTSFCRLLTDVTYACFTVLIPLILMIIFGLMAISNVREVRSYIESRKGSLTKRMNTKNVIFISKQTRSWKKLERHLRRMLLLQVIVVILLTLPQAIHKLYLTMTSNAQKSALEYSFDRFLYNLDLLLPYLESGMPFYIYTLTGGQVFRRALAKLIYRPGQK
jgi:hypothetical protein